MVYELLPHFYNLAKIPALTQSKGFPVICLTLGMPSMEVAAAPSTYVLLWWSGRSAFLRRLTFQSSQITSSLWRWSLPSGVPT